MKIKNRKFSFSLKDMLITILIMFVVTALSFVLKRIDANDAYVPMLFILAVFFVSRYTTGYLHGIVCSVVGVFLVNCIFTYPYFELNFTISGYPIIFISMFVTSVMTSAMTTRIKQEEEIRIESEKEKIRANLLRAISHDLRTPLTSIIGSISAVIDNEGKLSGKQQRELLVESREEALWLVRMVENLLSVTRMNEADAKIIKTNEAVEEIISESIRKFNKNFPDAVVTVSVPDELLMVPMDAILIEQVICNLLENAVIHGKREDGISLSVIKKDNNAQISVSDCGKGINENVLGHLFRGGAIVNASENSDNKRNMGIGLSVCNSIVKIHGGELTAENRPQGGAEFTFTLPIKE